MKPGFFFAAILIAFLVFAPLCLADAQPSTKPASLAVAETLVSQPGLVVAKLENGLTVIVKRSAGTGVVTVRGYVRAGSIFEDKWLGCGVSHLLEHLVAEGAEHDGQGPTADQAKNASSRVAQIGGQSNAYTSLSYTCYYISAAAGKTDDCVALVADWLARPEITKEAFEREHGVVQRELEMRKNEPSRQIWQANMANAFAGHPAEVPIIGYQSPLSKLTHEDVLAYHKKMYIPQNMIFCVVGDIDPRKVLEKTRQEFAGMEPGRVPSHSLPQVPPISGVKRALRQSPAISEIIGRINFRTIPLLHEDLYALDVLSYVLSEGKSSRLFRKIQRENKLVTSISSGSWTPDWGNGIFVVSFRAKPENADAAEAAIIDELKKIAADGVTADELKRAKRQKVADFVYSQQTIESQAQTLAGDFLSTGDINFSQDYTDKIQAVTAEQVQKAARKYFTFDKMAVTLMVPKAEAPATQPTTQAGEKNEEISFELPNGLRVILQPTNGGLVSMTFATKGGLLLEDERTNGFGTLMTALSTKGAGELSAEQIAEFFDSAGGQIVANCGNNTFYWQATVLEDSSSRALDIFADVIIRPTLSEKELEILRPVQLAKIRMVDENWQSQLQKFFRSNFFNNPQYKLLPVGSEEVVASATAEQIKQWHKSIHGGASVLTVYGKFNADEARKKIETLFEGLPAGMTKLSGPIEPKTVLVDETTVLKTKNTVAGVIVAVPGMTLDNLEDRFAIDVLDTIISGYHLPDGWLHNELRGKQLVYVVHAYNWMGLLPGAFITYAAGQPENVEKVVEIIKDNLSKASQYTPTQQEIDRAVNVILTAELLGNQELSARSLSAALDELYYGFSLRSKLEQYYRKVTPADVARVAKKYLSGPYVTIVTSPQNFETEDLEDKNSQGLQKDGSSE